MSVVDTGSREYSWKMDNIGVKALRRVDLTRATGCNLETIRYYETVGIMPDPPRTPKGYRSYDDTHVRRLKFVMRSRDLGFSLEEIRGLLGLVDDRTQTCAQVQTVAEAHLEDVKAKIADLERIERVLSETVARCTGDAAPECAVIDALLGA
ncbi:MerR family transcriptional regulator [Phaeobacter gallaeciensis]|uniref:MerR family transcriptional regulator n=2 Tax=Alphaproteobacteria TaxID=28211 RepID=UPI00237F136D|nr:helix-turn-helix domain-containing protein [Phaeobacter gallaeciensis]MDE4377285.1 helix-turn-helix domain-containing protein [Phaeobacter gallaeciensis]